MKENVTVNKTKHPRYNYIVRYSEGGQRREKNFKIKSGENGADAWAEKKREELENHGNMLESITQAERNAVIEFRELVSSLPRHAQSVTLSDAVKTYSKGIKERHKSVSCSVVADKYISKLKISGCSKRHIETIEGRVNRFNADYGDWLAYDVSSEIIDDFLISLNLAPRTQINYRLAINGFFNHAIKMKATPTNPVKDAIKTKVLPSETGILNPKQVYSLLLVADDRTLPALAISFFAGLRRSEIERLDWSEIDLEEGHIEVKARKSKSAQRRLVPISDNLKSWLAPYEQLEGKVTLSPQIFRKGFEKARKAAGITDYPHNAGRHSYASYHLAMHDDAGKLATSLGHPNPTMLYKHYRAIVKPKNAVIYWDIVPDDKEEIIPDDEDKITHIKTA